MWWNNLTSNAWFHFSFEGFHKTATYCNKKTNKKAEYVIFPKLLPSSEFVWTRHFSSDMIYIFDLIALCKMVFFFSFFLPLQPTISLCSRLGIKRCWRPLCCRLDFDKIINFSSPVVNYLSWHNATSFRLWIMGTNRKCYLLREVSFHSNKIWLR
jgi:hypothetical protein